MADSVDWSILDGAPGKFEPRPHYDADTDSLTFFVSDDESYRERVDHLLTVYRSIASNQVVGCHVKDVKKVLATVQLMNVGIKTNSVTLGLLLMGVPWAELKDPNTAITLEHRLYQEIVAPLSRAAGVVTLDIPELAGI